MIKGRLVSVIIPVYNGENFIGEAIESVLRQTYSNFELIIVNDNSIDKTEEVVLSYSDPRIRYYKNEANLGMVKNWNKGLEYSHGDYVKILCHDDILHERCLEVQAAALLSNRNVSLVTNASNVIDSNKNILLVRRNFDAGIYNGRAVAKQCINTSINLFGETSVYMFRKSVLKLSGGFIEGICYAPDMDFCVRALKHCDMYYSEEVLSSFRLSSTNETAKIFSSKKLKIITKILKEDKAFLNRYLVDMPLTSFEILNHYIRTIGRFMLRDMYLKSLYMKSRYRNRKGKLNVLEIPKLNQEAPSIH